MLSAPSADALTALDMPLSISAATPKKKSTTRKSTPKKSTPKKPAPKKSTPKKTTPKKSTPQPSGSELDRKRREQAENTEALTRAAEQIEANERRAARSLDELTRVSGELNATRRTLDRLSSGLDSLNRAIHTQRDSLTLLRAHYARLLASRTEALRQWQRTPRNADALTYIAGASSLSEAYARIRYIRAYNDAWRRRTAELRSQAERIHAGTLKLQSLQAEQTRTATQVSAERDRLAGKQRSERQLVDRLKGDNANLRKVIERRKQQARRLEQEIDRLIAEEIERERREAEERARREAEERRRREGNDTAAPAKPTPSKPTPSKPVTTPEADRVLTGNFESNKGKLLFPIRGSYSVFRPFGRSKHPDLPMVETDNSGVDLEVANGTRARAVFDGTVTGVFKLPGYHTVVIVRHGDYLSLYANLGTITVHKGSEVKAGQELGTVVDDPEATGTPGKTLFHFELRHKRTKLNPMEWVK